MSVRRRLPTQCRAACLALAGEPAAVDDLGLALQDRLEQLGPVVGVVLEVGVLDEHEIARAASRPVRTAAPLPRSRWVTTRTVESSQRRQDLLGAVGRPVVDDDDLERPAGRSTARMRRRISATVLRSLYTGTMTDSVRYVRCGRRRRPGCQAARRHVGAGASRRCRVAVRSWPCSCRRRRYSTVGARPSRRSTSAPTRAPAGHA